jgi:hypothetical protein
MRTQLNNIIGLIILMDDDNKNMTNSQLKNLSLIKESGLSLMSILSDIIDYYKLKTKQMNLNEKYVEVRTFINEIIRDISWSLYEKNISFSHMISKDVPNIIYIDVDKFQQIIINILTNSIQLASKGAKIIMNISCNDTSELYVIVKNAYSEVPLEYEKRIFDPFYKSNNSNTLGIGLGLTIAKGLCELMNGKIYAENDNKNKIFNIYFNLKIKSNNVQNSNVSITNKIAKNILIFVKNEYISKIIKEVVLCNYIPIIISNQNIKNIESTLNISAYIIDNDIIEDNSYISNIDITSINITENDKSINKNAKYNITYDEIESKLSQLLYLI